MPDIQTFVFRWALAQPEATSLVIFALGILFGLQGFRFARVLLAMTCAAGGFFVGTVVAALTQTPGFLLASLLAGGLGALAVWKYHIGIGVGSMVTFAAVGHYLVTRFGVLPSTVLLTWLVGAAFGLSLFYLYKRQTPIVVTTVQGAALMIVGFLGLASRVAPSLAETFVSASTDYPIMVPILAIMLIVLGYSVQASAHQGDVTTGGGGGWSSVDAET